MEKRRPNKRKEERGDAQEREGTERGPGEDRRGKQAMFLHIHRTQKGAGLGPHLREVGGCWEGEDAQLGCSGAVRAAFIAVHYHRRSLEPDSDSRNEGMDAQRG